MKRKSVQMLSAVLASASLLACQSHDSYYDENAATDIRVAKYSYAFTNAFGSIDPTNDWGFGEAATKAVTRGASTNANQWGDTWLIPDDVTEADKAEVIQWFKSHQNPESLAISFSDFFVTQVYKGQNSYKDAYGQTVNNASSNMNQLCAGGNDVINNSNNGTVASTNVGLGNNQYSQRAMMLMTNSSTESFSYQCSTDNQRHYKYAIQEINGEYYVGFDFEANGQNPNQQVEADGYYDDWIIRLTPATPKNSKRIFAEDLGTIGDFDFNDVVLDAGTAYSWQDNSNVAYITLRAAGGTLPIYIGNDDEANEVHARFGVSTSTPVNVKGSQTEYPPVQFKIKGNFDSVVDIPIIIKNGSETYHATATVGEAPSKVACPVGTAWTSEGVSITKKYPNFANYVGAAATYANWYE